jgi:hypothetical protein
LTSWTRASVAHRIGPSSFFPINVAQFHLNFQMNAWTGVFIRGIVAHLQRRAWRVQFQSCDRGGVYDLEEPTSEALATRVEETI